MKTSAWHIGIVIPARNEEALLARCLDSVLVACSLLPAGVTFDIVVGIDCSTDQSLHIARRMLRGYGTVVSTNAGVVGCTRALAADVVLRRYSGALDRCWLANTDADCVVPPTWLNDQLMLARGNIEAIAGTVDVDSFAEHEPGVEQRFSASYLLYPDGSHPHIHGANLGVRADAYARVGGWGRLPTAEDHDLWERLRQGGARGISVSWLQVLTSGRRVGRAPLGFADALSAHNNADNKAIA